MSINGVKQLRKLVINYNITAAGSNGLREFMSRYLYPFAEANPDINIIAKPITFRGIANVTAQWLNGRRETIPLANLEARAVLRKINMLRNRVGRDERDLVFQTDPETRCKSVQGRWTVELNRVNDLSKPDLVINGVPNTPPKNPWDKPLELVSDGLPHPNTHKSWEEVGADSMKHLEKWKEQKAKERKAAAEHRELKKKDPKAAEEVEKKWIADEKVRFAKIVAKEEADKKAARAAAGVVKSAPTPAPAKGKK